MCNEQGKILKELSPDEYEEYHNVKDAIFDLFKKGVSGKLGLTAVELDVKENLVESLRDASLSDLELAAMLSSFLVLRGFLRSFVSFGFWSSQQC